jgi:hypothetical protein
MGIEESIAKILTNQSEIFREVAELRTTIENHNAFRFVMRVPDLTRELGISEKTIIQYEKKRLLKSYRLVPDGLKYYKRDEVYSFLNSKYLKGVESKKE